MLMPKQVLFDTNFMLIPGRYKKDVVGMVQALGYEIIVLEQTHRELEKLASSQSKTAIAAHIGLLLIKQKGLNIVPGSKRYTDAAIVEYCKTHGVAAATIDAKLRAMLKAERIATITFNRSGKLTEETDVLQTQSTRSHSRAAR